MGFALDMYGKGVRPTDGTEASELNALKNDPPKLHGVVKGGLTQLVKCSSTIVSSSRSAREH